MLDENGKNAATYEFEGHRLDAAKRILYGLDDTPLLLKPKAFDTLLFLLENPGRVIERDEIMAAVWPETVVEENNLTQHISTLRRLLGEGKNDHRYIVTVPGRGYEFTAHVTRPTSKHDKFPIIPEPDTARTRSRNLFIVLTAGLAISLLLFGFLLQDRRAPAATGPIKSIAILPFRPISDEGRIDVLELGMADTLISRFGKIKDLEVRPLSSVLNFRGPDHDAVAVGKALNVDLVLEPNLQRLGERIRVNVRLIRVADGFVIWTDTINESSSDLLGVQDKIAARILNSVPFELSGEERLLLGKRSTNSSDAYEYYLYGRQNALKGTKEGIRSAIASYEKAISADPTYALAYAAMADAYRTLAFPGFARSKEVCPQARELANKALELDPTLAEGYTILGYIDFLYDWDMASAEANFRRSIELGPNNSDARRAYSLFLSHAGRHDEAIGEIRLAKELSPQTLIVQVLEGQSLLFAGRDEEALSQFNKVVDFDPNYWIGHYNLGRAYLFQGRYEEAIAELSKATELNAPAHMSLRNTGYAYARMGDYQKAQKIIDELKALSAREFIPYSSIAMIYIAMGQKEEALNLLEKALDERETYLVLLKSYKLWDDLRSEPRFAHILKRMNLND